jgi:hypothetical protein
VVFFGSNEYLGAVGAADRPADQGDGKAHDGLKAGARGVAVNDGGSFRHQQNAPEAGSQGPLTEDTIADTVPVQAGVLVPAYYFGRLKTVNLVLPT